MVLIKTVVFLYCLSCDLDDLGGKWKHRLPFPPDTFTNYWLYSCDLWTKINDKSGTRQYI